MLFDRSIGRKDFVTSLQVAYSDLDSCPPDKLLVPPHMVVCTSTNRWQGYWRLDRQDYPPVDIEDMNRRIAYTHLDDGADKSGWDLTQLLRVPYTLNFKYAPSQYIKVADTKSGAISLDELGEVYTQESITDADGMYPYPVADVLPEVESIDLMYARKLHPGIQRLRSEEPDGSWSEPLWRLLLELFEIGMTREETFVIAREAACNKYRRDNRSDRYLWVDVSRAWVRFAQAHRPVTGTFEEEQILTEEELAAAATKPSFVEEYVEWATSLGDAAGQYHEAGAFVILSSLLAGNVRLPTSYGVLLPNLWFMILADTTLTRKSTAMDVAMDLVVDIDPDVILATDGSIEGLFTGMSTRPGKPSVFLRDEFSGLVEQMTRKDYYAGMAETLTKLYDGKYQKRILRRETIEVKEPVLILFAGGIKNRILSLLTWEQVSSGFLPRFLFITAESDVTKLRRLGPPTDQSEGKREYILSKLRAMHAFYSTNKSVTIGHGDKAKQVQMPSQVNAELTPQAWDRYADIEELMLKAGVKSPQPDLATPTLDRMCKSGLKMAVLLAACRQHSDPVVVDIQDIIKAFSYISKWREYTSEVLDKIGQTTEEKTIQRVHHYIASHEGCLRSEVMQHFALNARTADTVLTTLEQRDLITRSRASRGERLSAFHFKEGKR